MIASHAPAMSEAPRPGQQSCARLARRSMVGRSISDGNMPEDRPRSVKRSAATNHFSHRRTPLRSVADLCGLSASLSFAHYAIVAMIIRRGFRQTASRRHDCARAAIGFRRSGVFRIARASPLDMRCKLVRTGWPRMAGRRARRFSGVARELSARRSCAQGVDRGRHAQSFRRSRESGATRDRRLTFARYGCRVRRRCFSLPGASGMPGPVCRSPRPRRIERGNRAKAANRPQVARNSSFQINRLEGAT